MFVLLCSQDVFASISSPSVERTLSYSNTVTVPLTLSSSTNLAGLHEDPAIVTVVSSSSRQQVRIRRVIKKGPSQVARMFVVGDLWLG